MGFPYSLDSLSLYNECYYLGYGETIRFRYIYQSRIYSLLVVIIRVQLFDLIYADRRNTHIVLGHKCS